MEFSEAQESQPLLRSEIIKSFEIDFEESEEKYIRPQFDKDKIYFPLFCTTEVPENYFKELESFYPIGEAPWLEILTRDPGKILQSSEDSQNAEISDSTPFKGYSVEELSEFFKSHLRSSDESALGGPFTHFTFIVVDEACFDTKPLSCIVCCDAPDFAEGEDEIKLKSIRMDFDDATNWLPAFEELALTPEEYDDKEELLTFGIMPPPTMRFTDRVERYRFAPMAQARRNKRRALRIVEEAITKQAREARTNKKGASRSSDVDQTLIENAQRLTIDEPEAPDSSEPRGANSQDQQDTNIETASKGDDEEVSTQPKKNSKTRIDPAKEDITITARRKVDVVHGPNILRQIRLFLYQDKDDEREVRLIDNRTGETSRLDESRLAMHAAGPTRSVYSSMRRVYGPIVQGKEDPVIVSKGRDVGLSMRSDSSSGSE
ncbi:MAG: hypothetical protein OHK93_007208 [Ramalina farinacea]|uniref:Uncharacterized protein n=1 Tax=Ramalina farinacea TaxID=258253 RepID=A0AA43TU64_9LECA|nr:hypothetical protein [Ramalina farinacea]